ncbi:sirohydrochlorin cobaltochelatase [Paramaledivibacter caminithermalis]|uniref:Sirohydrochlorin cobaltochelatase n=1 Tax=Paramaledivibacter caminithermalis (strain DSM 15212 / CIP 107654 / DViRD3) TaxID=1121301 RepID=A0A1M6KV69_PARC5|nr:sirohydrochlorin cobaltochelatase [Paramaledivibacter caminithermalis]SHJ62754.1 sirohydrochlorin cobaltochelatase [Paramaledivibacter caminithermalis DSM 15212]
MRKILMVLLVAILVIGSFTACTTKADSSAKANAEENKEAGDKKVEKDPNKKAILVVSFGTSYADTRKVTIEACEEKIAKAFPEYDVRRAFTSQIIIDKLKKRDNIIVDNPTEAFTKLRNEGFSKVYVQPLHVINGAEYDDLVNEARVFEEEFDKLVLGRPLLTSIDDYRKVVAALSEEMPERADNEAVVFMGHGTHHDANAAYACLDYVFEDEDEKNVFVGTVEGFPELDTVIKKLEKNNIEKVTLMPLMLVAGDHAQNDMAGDEEDSWKMILKGKGYEVDTILRGLGEFSKIQDLYIEHLKTAIEGETH